MTKRDLLSGIYEHKSIAVGYIVAAVLLTAILTSQATRRKMIKKENSKTINYINMLAEKFEETIGNQKKICPCAKHGKSTNI